MPDFEPITRELELYLAAIEKRDPAPIKARFDGEDRARWQIARFAALCLLAYALYLFLTHL